jgi:hypothetical protein
MWASPALITRLNQAPLLAASGSDVQGHGLWIVRVVADEFTASSGPQGSQVTAMFGWRDGPGLDRTQAT